MRRFWRMGTLTIILLFAGCGTNSTSVPPTFELPATPTTTAGDITLQWTVVEVTQGNVTSKINLQGELVAKEEQQLFFTMPGVLKDVYVQSGDSVQTGDIIAELAAESYEEQVLIRASELLIAQLTVQNLEAQTRNVTSIYTLDIAKERVRLAEARYQHSQHQLAATILTSPFTGSITSFSFQRGDNVGAYVTVGHIADTSDVSVQVMIPSTLIDMVSPINPVEVWVAGRVYNARVNDIDPNTTLWQGEDAHRVSVIFDARHDPPKDINYSANVIIAGETTENVLLLPVDAVDIFPGQAYVDVVEGANLRRVPVEVGVTDGLVIEVRNGLTEGQVIALP